MKILEKEKEAKKSFKDIGKLKGEVLKESLINHTLRIQEDFEKSYENIEFDGVHIDKIKEFSSKFELSEKIWSILWKKADGRIKIDPNDSIIIPNKVFLLQNILNKFSTKSSYTKEEVVEIHNGYKTAFEVVIKIISPHFKKILNKTEYLEWSDINNEITNLGKEFKALFKSMNGHLRNAEGHGSSYIEDNLFVWIKDDGSRDTYPIKKILTKIGDLVFLILALSRGLNKIYIENLIKKYREIHSSELEKIYANIPI